MPVPTSAWLPEGPESGSKAFSETIVISPPPTAAGKGFDFTSQLYFDDALVDQVLAEHAKVVVDFSSQIIDRPNLKPEEKANLLAADVETRVKRLNYAKAAEMLTTIIDQKTVRGIVVIDERTNSLLLTDLPPESSREVRDALHARLVEDVRALALGLGHRLDDRLDTLELRVV